MKRSKAILWRAVHLVVILALVLALLPPWPASGHSVALSPASPPAADARVLAPATAEGPADAVVIGAAGGAVACGTGILCVAGAPAIASGATLAAHGVGTATTAAAEAGTMAGDRLTKMLGDKGAQFPSQTLWRGKQGHLNAENPAPGTRPGQIHFQTPGSGKNVLRWTYDPTTGTFLPTEKGVLPPPVVD